MSQKPQSLVSAIYERYSEVGEGGEAESFSSCSPPVDEEKENSKGLIGSPSNHSSSGISFYIPPVYSPRKTRNTFPLTLSEIFIIYKRFVLTESGLVMASVRSLVMSNQLIDEAGDCDELQNCCRNVFELDISKNQFTDWDEVHFFFHFFFLSFSKTKQKKMLSTIINWACTFLTSWMFGNMCAITKIHKMN